MNNLSKSTPATDVAPPFGPAHPRRGLRYHELAVDFAKQYPLGSALTQKDFGLWVQVLAQNCDPDDVVKLGLFTVPGNGVDANSDTWKAYLHRRNELRYNINKAAAHPRMIEAIGYSYVIETETQGHLEVRATYDAAAHTNLPRAIESLIKTKRKGLRYLQESIDFTQLQPYMQMQIKEMAFQIDALERRFCMECDLTAQQFERLRAAVRSEVETGRIVPKNGGITQLIAPVGKNEE